MSLPRDIDAQFQAYFSGDTSPEVIEVIEQWLRKDPANPRLFAEFGLIDRLLACEQKKLDASAIFALLLEAEESAETIVVADGHGATDPEPDTPPAHPISLRDLASTARYLSWEWLKRRAAVKGSIAAALAVGVLLFILFSGQDNTPGTEPLASNPAESNQDGGAAVTPRAPALAAITSEQGARWAGGAHGLGDALYNNQRLILAEGVAEVTTRHGARALLQAPCEVVITGENEVRLTRGRLVGKCLTRQSKGFVVDTPSARIVDIGTEFGVHVDAVGDVGVRVFSGLVDVEAGPGGDQKQSLVTGDLARIESGRLKRVAYDAGLDFQRDLTTQALIPVISGQIRWLSSPPTTVRLSDFEDSQNAYLFLESANTLVPMGTGVNKSPRSEPITPYGRTKLDRTIRADIYMLHFDPVNGPNTEPVEVKGRIEFGRPILAVITHHQLLHQSDQRLGHPQVQYESKSPTRGLERPQVEVGEDGQSLIVYISSVANGTDQLRVLVAAEDEGP